MDRASKLPVLRRRQRRRDGAGSPVLKIWLFSLSSIFFSLLMLFAIPTTAAAVGGLYLAEQTPPWVDRIVEGVAVEAVAFYAENIYEGDLPSPTAVEDGTAREFKTTKVYDRTGQHLLWEVYDPRGGNRQVVALEAISPNLINATIALEDKTFYENPGVNLRGMTRALYGNLTTGEIVGGGSSITQQLIKLVAIDPEERFEQSYERKIKEVILAIELSRLHDKETILEWYLNTINYGRLAYGAEAAAGEYFGKHASELTIAEAAMLAMLPNAPAFYDPYNRPEEAVERQQIVLRRMWEEGYISHDEYQVALEEPVLEHLAKPQVEYELKAPHFTLYVVRELEQKYGSDLLYRGGLTVYSTLDYKVFQQQEQVAREHIATMQADGVDASNAAVITINPRTGEVISMVGSLDYANEEIDGEINMAIVPRQPGSSIKPYTFLTALANGYTLASMVWDVRTVFDDYPNPPYVPENYYRDYNGPVLFRNALAMSLNIPSVKVMDTVGIDRVIDTMHRMGINTLRREDVGLSLTLGGGEITLLDHVYAFSVLANNGVMAGEQVDPLERRPGFRELNPVTILRVEDARGQVITEYTQPETRQILSPQLAYLMQNVMSDNESRIPAFGEDNKLNLPDRPAAAKTGTTNDFRDGWTLGFTPQYVTGVWVGNADYRDMGKEAPGGSVAAPIWQRAMMALHEGLPVEPFPVPEGIVQVQICAKSGMLPTPNCPEVKTEVFIEGTQPTTPDTLFQGFRICGSSGRLATVYCPPNQVRTQVYMMVPPEAEDWARASDIPLPPTAYDSSRPNAAGGPVSISRPAPYGYISGAASIDGNAYIPTTTRQMVITSTDNPTGTVQNIQIDNFQLYRIQVGQGLDPTSWTQIGPDHYEPRNNQTLEFWDTRRFADGLYTIQLIVLDTNGRVQRALAQVTVDNVAPTVSISYPYPNEVYELGGDSWLNIQAEVNDNIAIDRVEFYVNGELYESSSSSFNVRWVAEDANLTPGEERQLELWAVAVDAAGNRTQSEKLNIRVIRKD
ncbi:MAG: transglycosylase domain-containing protein [Ardenticatenales bacterium]|nr:transglycosylase domain-containing protein [Ardenticatenales bacterium]